MPSGVFKVLGAGNMLELNTEKEGCMSYTTLEDAQGPQGLYMTYIPP